MMHHSLLHISAVMSLVFTGTGCNLRPSPVVRPIDVKWNFEDGMGGWRTLHPEVAEIVRDRDVVCLRLQQIKLPKKPPYDGNMWMMLHLGERQADKVSMRVVAKAATPETVPLSLGITCQTGKQDGPTYGVLAADSVDCHLTSDWATHETSLPIPKGTHEIQLSVSINVPKSSDDASVHIRSVEYRIDRDHH